MPPDSEGLPDEAVKKLKAWIDEGLDWDESLLPTPPPKTKHWSFQPVKRPEIPKVKNHLWVKTPVDAFIASKHETLGLIPARGADVNTLARRRSLDLTGLPPEVFNGKTEVDQLLEEQAVW